jgi:fructosamine-3-kinase
VDSVVGWAVCERFGLGDRARRVTQVHGGMLNVMWRVETASGTFAVKQVKLRHDRPHMARRYRRARELELAALHAGIALPRPIPDPVTGDPFVELDTELGRVGIVVHAWVVADRVRAGPVRADFAARVGGALGRLHALAIRPTRLDDAAQPREPMPTRVEWSQLAARAETAGWEWARRLGTAVPAFGDIGTFVDQLAARTTDQVMSHRDIHQANLLDARGEPIILDWESAGPTGTAEEIGHTLLDLADAAHREPDPALLAGFLRTYASEASIPDLGPYWLTDWFSAYTRFAYFNVRRCLGDYDDPPDELERAATIVDRAIGDLPNRLGRVETLTRQLADAIA